jgi:hypothetical protein
MSQVRSGVRAVGALFVIAAVLLTLAAGAVAAPPQPGAQRITYKVGPLMITPGQNRIDYTVIKEKPQVDGYITRIKPDLIYANGKVPRVDVLHLHHGVWANLARKDATSAGVGVERFFAAGEEKTIFTIPQGYGYAYHATDTWILNHMIHNLITTPTQVYLTYTIDFIPATAPQAEGIRQVRPIWMDVQNGKVYPVFDVPKGAGSDGTFTYPTQAPRTYASDGVVRNEWTVDRDGVLVATAGHLHPGGLHTDLWVERAGATAKKVSCASKRRAAAKRRCIANRPSVRGDKAHLFRSDAKYFEPAGAVSWDVAMTATPADWRVKLHKGDTLSTTATYDSKRAAWYESMGIMVAYMADDGPGEDPFAKRVDWPGKVTHGHLDENRNHGGKRVVYPDPRKLPDGVFAPGGIDIRGFTYQYGDLALPGERGRPPVVRRGQSLLYTLSPEDDGQEIYHSLTSCKLPCNRDTGIAYPLADGKFQFDSGQLGTKQIPPATGKTEYRTPSNLPTGTYSYFCRIHPTMRGAFRVEK